MKRVLSLTARLLTAAAFLAAQERPDASLTQPFLKVFFARPAEVETHTVLTQRDGAQVRGYVAYPALDRRLPAILLLPGGDALGPAVQRIARDIAGIGFVALAIDYDPDHTAGMSPLVQAVSAAPIGDRVDAAAAWLGEQPFVDGRRVGAVGWATGAEWVLRLEREGKVRAGVVSGGSICAQADALRRSATPVLVIADRRSGCTPSVIGALQSKTVESYWTALQAFPDAADEQLWVRVYEFLSKHLEDAPAASSGQERNQIASVVDIMRVINSDDGVKGRLSRSLAAPPSGDKQWDQARSEAAILAEAGNLLLALPPPKGPEAGWRERAIEFRGAAEDLLRALQRRDFVAVQQALRLLPRSCASCHADYR